MQYAILVDNELVYAKEYYICQDGTIIIGFNKKEDVMREYGFKPVIDEPPVYDETKEELCKVGVLDDIDSLKILYATKPIDIDGIKLEKILQTKEDLATYLFNNPIFSTCHYADGAYYAVTAEKQAQLTQLLTSYILDSQLGVINELHWNSTGNMCEAYTFEELTQLRREIYAFVLPLVSLQQYIEVMIQNATTTTEINAIDTTITYEKAMELAKQNQK